MTKNKLHKTWYLAIDKELRTKEERQCIITYYFQAKNEEKLNTIMCVKTKVTFRGLFPNWHLENRKKERKWVKCVPSHHTYIGSWKTTKKQWFDD